MPIDQKHNGVVQSDERFQNFRLLTKEKKTTICFADREALYSVGNPSIASSADQPDMEGNRAKTAQDIIKAGRAALSTTAWRASCLPRGDSDDEYDEIWSELVSDDDYDCPYELLTLEEAFRQFDENKKAGLASGNHASLAALEKGYKLMPIQETLMWNNGAAERSSAFNVRCGEAIVQRAWVKYDVEINVQRNHF